MSKRTPFSDQDDKCPDCGGEGRIIGYSLFTGEKVANMLCPKCEGSGKKDMTNADG